MSLDDSPTHSAAESHDPESARMLGELTRRAQDVPAEYYSLAQPGVLFAYTRMIRGLVHALVGAGMVPLRGKEILDVGCGWGSWLAELETWGAEQERLAGVDLEPARAAHAARRLPAADVRTGNATALPWGDGTFDIVLTATLFSSVLDPATRVAIAGEIARVLRPGGVVLWFDFFRDNPRNRNVRGIRRSELERLFPAFELDLEQAILAPPIARRLAGASWLACTALEAMRLLNTHLLGVLRRP